MNRDDSKYAPRKRSCGKCGIENLYDARFCKACGYFLGEATDETSQKPSVSTDLAPPRASAEGNEIERKSVERCPRCGQDVRGLERCPICGLIAPLNADAQDDFIGDFMVGMPVMLSRPEKFAEILPYRRGLHSLIQPILWTTLFFIIFWVTIYLAGAKGLLSLWGVKMPVASFLIISITLLVLVLPWIIMTYILILHGTALLVGGRGIIERTARTLCILLSGAFLFTGTMITLYYISIKMLDKYQLYLSSSPWHEQYMAIPLILKIAMFAGQFYLLIVQVRLLARVHYIEIIRSAAAHIIAAIPFVVLFVLNSYGYI